MCKYFRLTLHSLIHSFMYSSDIYLVRLQYIESIHHEQGRELDFRGSNGINTAPDLQDNKIQQSSFQT